MEAGYLLLFLTAFILAATGTALVTHLATKFGFVDAPTERKAHASTTPLGGGIAIFAGVVLTFLIGVAGAVIVARMPRPGWMSGALHEHLPNVTRSWRELAVLLGCGTVLFVMGLIDDVKNLRWRVKLTVQLAVAIAAVAGGFRASLYLPHEWMGGAITVVWLVGITNAFNFLDNVDGLSAGIAFIISGIFFVTAILTGQLFVASLLAVLAGAVGGFLVHNFPPARIFMGDAGSLFIGFTLGALAVSFTYRFPASPGATSGQGLLPIILPLLIFAVPIYDAASVILIRLREGRSPFDADRRHFSHRLIDLGMTPREAVITLYIICFALGVAGTQLYKLNNVGCVVMLVQAAAILFVLAVLEHAGKRSRK
jgi:UDP-GlcNAc:undecaprenyl-phosphate GlcNAc-1-phosphate transferase